MTVQPVGNLVDAVGARAGVDNASVLEVLAAHGIPTATVPTARRSLRVIRLRLRGTKTGVPDAGPFDRTFTLPAGVVIAVGPNLRGKTSLLEIITLCLRGTPRELQLDVASWLDAVECDADVNGVPLRFRLAISDGQITEATIAELPSDGAPGTAEPAPGRTLVTANTAEEYAAAVDAFMLDRFGLDPIYAAVRDGGQQRHAWLSYFGALYPPTGGDKILLGETVMGGLAGRWIMVFLDLPGAALLTRVNALRETLRAQARTRTAAADPGESRMRSQGGVGLVELLLVLGPQFGQPSAAELRCVSLTLRSHPKTSNLFPEFDGMLMAAKWAFPTSHAARQTRASTRRSRRAVSICSLIVTRPSGQPRSGNWTL